MAASSSSTKPKRFASFDEEEFSKILGNKDADNTKRSTKQGINIFNEYLSEKNIDIDLETVDTTTLAAILSKFYVELRKSDGSHYKTSSMNALKAGINRHLKSVRSDIIDIARDREFTKANIAFKAALVELKKLGKGDIVHHDEIEHEDIIKLYNYFNQQIRTPAGLCEKVWFELSLYFCRRGRENLRTMTKDHFQARVDASQREYVTQNIDELTKKTREDNQSSRVDGARMYATPGDPNCPVASFKTYLSKLNDECDCLFQTPKQTRPTGPGPWYTKTPMGKNTLGNMMKSLSHRAKLSKNYTNHCIRTTSIRILDKEGFNDREICQVSGHNNQSSLASYTGRVSANQKMSMSNAFSRAIGVHVAHPVVPSLNRPTASHTIPGDNPVIQDAGQPSMIQHTVSDIEDNSADVNFDLDFNFDDMVHDVPIASSQLSVYSVHSEEVTQEVNVNEETEVTGEVNAVNDILLPLATNRAPNTSAAETINEQEKHYKQEQHYKYKSQNASSTESFYDEKL